MAKGDVGIEPVSEPAQILARAAFVCESVEHRIRIRARENFAHLEHGGCNERDAFVDMIKVRFVPRFPSAVTNSSMVSRATPFKWDNHVGRLRGSDPMTTLWLASPLRNRS